MPSEIESEIDVIYKEPVREIVSLWRREVDIWMRIGKPFSMFWVAGPDDKIASAIDLIAGQLGIDKGAVIEFEIDPTEGDLTNKLLQLVDRFKLIDADKVMMIARGFERVLTGTTDDYRLRAGHDWDQDVLEDSKNTLWGRLYRTIGKHLVVVTTIGFSAGAEAYDKAVISAVASQFKHGILKLK